MENELKLEHQVAALTMEATGKTKGIPDPTDGGVEKTPIDEIDVWLLIIFFLKQFLCFSYHALYAPLFFIF